MKKTNNKDHQRLSITFTGGEPTINPHFLEFADFLLEEKKRFVGNYAGIALTTNGQFSTQMANKSKKIQSEISAGELLDKISILEIKLSKINNKNSLLEINKEYKVLKSAKKTNIVTSDKIEHLFKEIKKTNLDLWNIEDKIRICEKNKDFGQEFIKLARSVYINNDKRAKIKSEINNETGSNIKEIKQYTDY